VREGKFYGGMGRNSQFKKVKEAGNYKLSPRDPIKKGQIQRLRLRGLPAGKNNLKIQTTKGGKT